MAFVKESLEALQERSYDSFMARLKPLERTARYNIIKVLSECDAGMYHQVQGDLSFLSEQIFPDTATGEYLRAHWSDRVPALYASTARGYVKQTGKAGTAVPQGIVYKSSAGKNYFSSNKYTIGNNGYVLVYVMAEDAGEESNINEGASLSISSSLVAGLDKDVSVDAGGIAGGVDGESDEEYLARVLAYLRNTTRYGKKGDFAAWAVDSSVEVSKAFEIKNFGIFGALLIQVIGGNQTSGVRQVKNLYDVDNYIASFAPPILYTIKTPELIEINPTIQLLSDEDTAGNRAGALLRLQKWLDAKASPGCVLSEETLRSVIIDGSSITSANLTVEGAKVSTTVMQYPVLRTVTWK